MLCSIKSMGKAMSSDDSTITSINPPRNTQGVSFSAPAGTLPDVLVATIHSQSIRGGDRDDHSPEFTAMKRQLDKNPDTKALVIDMGSVTYAGNHFLGELRLLMAQLPNDNLFLANIGEKVTKGRPWITKGFKTFDSLDAAQAAARTAVKTIGRTQVGG